MASATPPWIGALRWALPSTEMRSLRARCSSRSRSAAPETSADASTSSRRSVRSSKRFCRSASGSGAPPSVQRARPNSAAISSRTAAQRGSPLRGAHRGRAQHRPTCRCRTAGAGRPACGSPSRRARRRAAGPRRSRSRQPASAGLVRAGCRRRLQLRPATAACRAPLGRPGERTRTARTRRAARRWRPSRPPAAVAASSATMRSWARSHAGHARDRRRGRRRAAAGRSSVGPRGPAALRRAGQRAGRRARRGCRS